LSRLASGFKLSGVTAFQAATLFRQGSGVLIAILLAQSALSAAGIGQYEQLLYLGTLLTSFWVTGLAQSLLAEHPRLPAEQQQAFLCGTYLIFLALGGILALLLWWGRPWLLPPLVGQPELGQLGWFLLFLWLNLPFFLLENFYLLWERPRELFWVSALAHGLQVPAMLLPVYWGWGLEGALKGLVALGVLRHLWLLAALLRFGWSLPAYEPLRRWLRNGFPLVLYALVGALSVSFDSWLVNWHYEGDPDTFAIFRYGAREFPLATALAGAFSSAMLPGLSKDVSGTLPRLRARSLRLYHLLFPITFLLMASSDWWFPRLFSPAFAASAPLFNAFLMTTLSRLVFSRTVLIGLGANRAVFYFSLLELGFNIALGFALVPHFGLLGVAWATVLAYTLDKVLLGYYLYRRYGIRPGAYTPLGWLAGYGLVLVGGCLM